LLETNYHTQDNAVIVITKATSVLHLINLKKKLFYTKFVTSDFYTLRDSVMALIPQRFSHYRLYEKKNGFEVIFLQEYFEDISVIITTSP
jgi:hypothetical protein